MRLSTPAHGHPPCTNPVQQSPCRSRSPQRRRLRTDQSSCRLHPSADCLPGRPIRAGRNPGPRIGLGPGLHGGMWRLHFQTTETSRLQMSTCLLGSQQHPVGAEVELHLHLHLWHRLVEVHGMVSAAGSTSGVRHLSRFNSLLNWAQDCTRASYARQLRRRVERVSHATRRPSIDRARPVGGPPARGRRGCVLCCQCRDGVPFAGFAQSRPRRFARFSTRAA